MERRPVDEEEKKRVQRTSSRIILVITAILIVYIVCTLITKDMNVIIFEALLGTFVVVYTVLSDVVEPYRLGMMKDMTIGQRTALTKILLMDAVGVGALMTWIVRMNTDSGNDFLFPILIYLVTMRMKRNFKPEFEGTEEEEESREEGGE